MSSCAMTWQRGFCKIVMAQRRLVSPWLAVGDLVMVRRQLLNLARLAEATSDLCSEVTVSR